MEQRGMAQITKRSYLRLPPQLEAIPYTCGATKMPHDYATVQQSLEERLIRIEHDTLKAKQAKQANEANDNGTPEHIQR